MRRIAFHLYAGYAGTDTCEVLEFPDGTSDEEISNEAWEMALAHADMYGYYPFPEDATEEDEDNECYTDNIEGLWEEYDPKTHDMLKPGGGTWF